MTIRIIQTTLVLLLLFVVVCAEQTSEYLFNKGLLSQHSFYSGHTNPAFLHAQDYLTVSGSITPTGVNSFRLITLSFSSPINAKQSAGITLLRGNAFRAVYPAIWDPSTNSIVVMENAPYEDDILQVVGSYSYAPIDRLAFGTNLTILNEENRSGFGLSLGTNFRLSNHRFARSFIGLNYTNFISPSVKYKTGRVLPAGFSLFTRGEFFNKILNFDGQLMIRNYNKTDASEYIAISQSDGYFDIYMTNKTYELDYTFKVEVSPPFFSLFFLWGNRHLGVAGGTNIPYANRKKRIQLTYQYSNILGDNDIAYLHTISFLGEFGPGRRKEP